MTSPRVDIPLTLTTLISGEYKILIHDNRYAGWTGPVYPNNTHPEGGIDTVGSCGEKGCLYNIIKDPEEHINLATQMPDVLKGMLTKLQKYQATHFNPDRGNIWPGACDTALKKYGGFWGPFLP